MLYAESSDGIDWVKPALGIVAYGSPPAGPPNCTEGKLGGGDMAVLTLPSVDAANVRSLCRAAGDHGAPVPDKRGHSSSTCPMLRPQLFHVPHAASESFQAF